MNERGGRDSKDKTILKFCRKSQLQEPGEADNFDMKPELFCQSICPDPSSFGAVPLTAFDTTTLYTGRQIHSTNLQFPMPTHQEGTYPVQLSERIHVIINIKSGIIDCM